MPRVLEEQPWPNGKHYHDTLDVVKGMGDGNVLLIVRGQRLGLKSIVNVNKSELLEAIKTE